MASTYDLELLEDLIIVTLDPKSMLKQQVTATQFAEWELFALNENIRIKKRMKAVIGKPGKERYKERYIYKEISRIL